ncbi:MAG TPA: VCBS repeat-containing protein, partial [Pirellulaceae bacterium]|nr:VCBS repeat-containing protein [Pirellulaceae bacterium]
MKRIGWILLLVAWTGPLAAEDFALHTFGRQQLTDVYYSEGIAAGDLNRDGQVDIVYGPHWYAGPKFAEKREIFPARPQDRERYANHFFAWIYDFTGDGWNDVLTAGFPGTPAFVYVNPRAEAFDKPWP